MPVASVEELLLTILLAIIPVIIIAVLSILLYRHFTKKHKNS
jgi:flagellar basal body-associated protein FliL